MLEPEFKALISKIQQCQCETQTIEAKSAHEGCPKRLYDTVSAFSNQNDGGVIIFGLDETKSFKKVGVYDAQDLQKKLMEVGEEMTPIVHPVLSVYEEDGMTFVAAEIPPVDITDRPCFKTARGRLKGSFVRVGEADKPMTEYEVYSYEAFRKKYRDDTRPVEGISWASLDQDQLEQYLLKRRLNRPHLADIELEKVYELTGVTQEGKLTLAAVLLFGLYPQAYFPQLCMIASRVPGTEMGIVSLEGQRFIDSKRIEGTIPEMLESATGFLQRNMRNAVHINQETGIRTDIPEYPMDALREAILNALLHRDYSTHTENMPIQIIMFSDRVEIRNPGGLYGRLTVDQLGTMQPDTRNPFLVAAMEALGKTENRYSGIPRIRRAMEEEGLPEPVFQDNRGEFCVCLYNQRCNPQCEYETPPVSVIADKKGLLIFCKTPRSRKEIADFLGISSQQYAMRRYVEPLIQIGVLLLSNPEHPRSPKQTYQTNANIMK